MDPQVSACVLVYLDRIQVGGNLAVNAALSSEFITQKPGLHLRQGTG